MTSPASSGVEYLSLEDVLSLAAALGVGPVRDMGLLDSACYRPRSAFMGRQAYPALPAKAAALMHSLACSHALLDGNKRLALLATVVFLRISGCRLALSDDEAFDLTLGVAAGQFDSEKIEKRLRLEPVTT